MPPPIRSGSMLEGFCAQRLADAAGDEDDDGRDEWLAERVQAASGMGLGRADTDIRRAQTLRERLPITLQLWTGGIIDLGRVQTMEFATRPLSIALAGEVERRVYQHGGMDNTAQQFYRFVSALRCRSGA